MHYNTYTKMALGLCCMGILENLKRRKEMVPPRINGSEACIPSCLFPHEITAVVLQWKYEVTISLILYEFVSNHRAQCLHETQKTTGNVNSSHWKLCAVPQPFLPSWGLCVGKV